MIHETGKVLSIEDEALWVETVQQSTCNSCQAKAGCGQRLLNRFGVSTGRIRAALTAEPSLEDLRVGDAVEIAIAEGAVVMGSLLSYGLPIVFLVVGAYWGERLQGDLMAFLSGLLGLLTGVCVANYVLRVHFDKHFFVPIVVKRLPHADVQPVFASDRDIAPGNNAQRK